MKALEMTLTVLRALCGIALCLVVAGLGLYVIDGVDVDATLNTSTGNDPSPSGLLSL